MAYEQRKLKLVVRLASLLRANVSKLFVVSPRSALSVVCDFVISHFILTSSFFLFTSLLISFLGDFFPVRCIFLSSRQKREKAPEGATQPSTEVDLFISTEKIMVLNTDLKVCEACAIQRETRAVLFARLFPHSTFTPRSSFGSSRNSYLGTRVECMQLPLHCVLSLAETSFNVLSPSRRHINESRNFSFFLAASFCSTGDSRYLSPRRASLHSL